MLAGLEKALGNDSESGDRKAALGITRPEKEMRSLDLTPT